MVGLLFSQSFFLLLYFTGVTLSTQLDWSFTESEKLFCFWIDMGLGDAMAIMTNYNIMNLMAAWMVVSAGHISSDAMDLMNESELFK